MAIIALCSFFSLFFVVFSMQLVHTGGHSISGNADTIFVSSDGKTFTENICLLLLRENGKSGWHMPPHDLSLCGRLMLQQGVLCSTYGLCSIGSPEGRSGERR